MIAHQHAMGALLNGRYRVLSVLGCGGTGTVYLAEHIQLDTTVALKEVRSPGSGNTDYGDALEQCRREARLLVRLNHPNLPKVMDAFIENDRFYLAMEYIEGMTAVQLLQNRGHALEWQQVLQWGMQIADVLAYLHNQDPPIIFRDLKPNNIIIQPTGQVKLIDFGIARRFHANAQHDTIRLGSMGFSPPEQFGLHQTDQRSDIYSLGVTLHHLLTGHDPMLQPFRLPPAVELNPAVPAALSQLISRCAALEPAMRPADATEVLRELVLLNDGRAVVHIRAQGTNSALTSDEDDRSTAIISHRETADLSVPQHRQTQTADRLVGTRSINRLRVPILILAATLCVALWIVRGNRSPAGAFISPLTHVVNPGVPLLKVAQASHRQRTPHVASAQTGISLSAGHQADRDGQNAIALPVRSRKGQSRRRGTVARTLTHDYEALPTAHRIHIQLRNPRVETQHKNGEPSDEHLHDVDLDTMLSSDTR